MAGKTYYDVLDLSPDAGESDISDAYRLLASMLHPDKFQEGSRQQEVAGHKMRELNEAHSVLRDPEQRRQYDAWLRSLEQGAGHQEVVTESSAPRTTAHVEHEAREDAWWERLRDEDQVGRIARGDCIMCGQPLRSMDRLLGRRKHTECLLWQPDEQTTEVYKRLTGETG